MIGIKNFTYNNNFKLINISNYIKNIFKKYNILTSKIYIYEYPKSLIIKFSLFIDKRNKFKILNKIILLLKSLLVLKYNKNIEFNINISKNIFNDNDLIFRYISKKIRNKYYLLRFLKRINVK